MKKNIQKQISSIFSYSMTTILLLLALYAIGYILYLHYGKKLEGFLSMSLRSFSDYPSTIQQSQKKLLDSFERNETNELSNLTSQSLASYKPFTAMSSFTQITNNYKNWDSPNNGECNPTDLCGAIYENKNTNLNKSQNEINVNMNNYKNIDFSKKKVNLYNV